MNNQEIQKKQQCNCATERDLIIAQQKQRIAEYENKERKLKEKRDHEKTVAAIPLVGVLLTIFFGHDGGCNY